MQPVRSHLNAFLGLVLLVETGVTGFTTARAADPPPVVTLSLSPGLPLELVHVQPGAFEQGSPESESERNTDESRRTVHLSRGFLIGRYPVTRSQFERFASETGFRTEAEKGPSGGFGWDGTGLRQSKSYTWRAPGFPQEGDHPVTLVTYEDALAFCRWLKSKTGREFTLPTEAQWEYACRAGTTQAWHAGDTASAAAEIAWFKPAAEFRTHPVHSRKPNAWGLHIGGNVAEWCLDWYGPYPSGPVTDPLQSNPNLSDKPRRVLRGGSWLREVQHTRSAARHRNDPGSRNADNGFRVLTFQISAPIPSPSPATTPVAGPPTSTAAPSPPPAPPRRPEPRPPETQTPVPTRFQTHGPMEHPTGPGSFALWRIGGWLVIGLPALAVLGFVLGRLKSSFSRRAASSFPQQWISRHGPLSPPTPVDDGFWFTSDASLAGSGFLYSYWLNDQLHQGQVVYQPGPDGQQFVYTGSRPERITLQAQSDSIPDISQSALPQPPELQDPSPINRLFSSGRFPPAY